MLEKVSVEGQGDHYYARWLPVLDSPKDGPRLEFLEKSMPPICRSEMGSQTRVGKTIQISSHTPHTLLDSFLKSTCDALARTWGKSRAPLLLPEKGNPLDIWLAALFTADGRIKAAPGQLQSLHSSVKAWMRNLLAAGDENFRIAFQLLPPSEENGRKQTWELQFLLQSRSDPSLMITAEDIWFRSKDELAGLSRRLEHPQELLLAGLGYASRLFNPILTSLQARHPTGVDLDTRSAYAFLRDAAPCWNRPALASLPRPGGTSAARVWACGSRCHRAQAKRWTSPGRENWASTPWCISNGNCRLATQP